MFIVDQIYLLYSMYLADYASVLVGSADGAAFGGM